MRKIKGLVIMLLISLSLFGPTGCQEDGGSTDINANTTVSTFSYEQINAEEAKEIMDSGVEHIIIDARTDEEFAQGHIEGAILIPEYEIADRAEKELPDKDALILVYCRSGRRSKIASDELVNLGYSNVKEFGGIIDWPYEIVK
ncbi:MAG: rhodanese-like domain-containing protein [Ruminococcus sp.]|nr:rhodanese-like domain-containing protein [Ruminococcus sp.]